MTDQHQAPPNDLTASQPYPNAGDAYPAGEDWDDEQDDMPDAPAENVLDDWIVYPSMAVGILVTTFFPILLGQQLCLPLLSAAVLIPMFLWALRQGRPRKAIALGVFWVVVQSLSVIVASLLFQETAWQAVRDGLEYRSAWLQWIEGGPPVALAPSLAYGRQVVELALYSLAMALTGGLAGLLLLTVALDRLNFTVASLLTVAANPALAALVAWPLWMFVRTVGYLIIGAVLAEPIANLDLRPAFLAAWLQRRWRLLLIGLGVVLLGIALQVLLAPLYQTIVGNAIG